MIIRLGECSILINGVRIITCGRLTLKPGRVYCIRGRSGTGKTTFLRALYGDPNVKLSQGCIEFLLTYGDQVVQPFVPRLGTDIGVLQQVAPLWPHLSALTNAWLPWASLEGLSGFVKRRVLAQEQARHWLDALGIDKSIWMRTPQFLSGGERQRVALAAVLTFDPDCLLADEPTSGLDRMSVRRIVSILDDLAASGKIVIVTSHDVDLLDNANWIHLIINDQSHLELALEFGEAVNLR